MQAISHIHGEQELTDLAKRLLAMSSIGIYLTQDSHRYIHIDIHEISYHHPQVLNHKDFQGIDVESESCPIFILKEYGSFASCLNRIDKYLFPDSLLSIYDRLNFGDNNGTIIGIEAVE